MSGNFTHYIHLIANIVEFIGVLTILGGIVFTFIKSIATYNKPNKISYTEFRQLLGKSILLGLEILIAADIIGTVVTDPTLESVSVLGLIVIIRTLLSLSLQLEVDGKFPWQK